jgi:8-oxo-dGTP pyrophosphatase MutT (NUDIX family)
MEASAKTKGAHVVLYRELRTPSDSVEAVLLCKRTLNAPIHPGYWALFGGKLEEKDGGAANAAAKREVEEELGIKLNKDDLLDLCRIQVRRKDEEPFIQYFSCRLDYDMNRLTLRPQGADGKVEGEGLGWFSEEEVHHLTVRPEDRIAINAFFRREENRK